MTATPTHFGWTVVANISQASPGRASDGTRLLAPGAKVHLGQAYWGDAAERIFVTGRHRRSNRFVTCVVPLALCDTLRIQALYSPTLAERLQEGNAPIFATEHEAKSTLDRLISARTRPA